MFDCFLAITFTAMMVKDMMPVSSDTVPVITKFMLMCMALIYLALLTSSFSLVCRMRVKMPFIIRKIFIDFLGPMLFVTECCDAVKQYCTIEDDDYDHDGFPLSELPSPRIPWYHQGNDSDCERETYEASYSSGYPGTSENSYRESSRSGSRHQDDIFPSTRTKRGHRGRPFSSGYNSLEQHPRPSRYQLECLENIETLLDGVKQQMNDEDTKNFWSFVSKLADRMFLIAFLLSWLVMALTLFFKVPSRPGSGL